MLDYEMRLKHIFCPPGILVQHEEKRPNLISVIIMGYLNKKSFFYQSLFSLLPKKFRFQEAIREHQEIMWSFFGPLQNPPLHPAIQNDSLMTHPSSPKRSRDLCVNIQIYRNRFYYWLIKNGQERSEKFDGVFFTLLCYLYPHNFGIQYDNLRFSLVLS